MIITAKPMKLIRVLTESDPDKLWDLEEHKDKKSNDQNAYYWALCTKLAAKLGISKARLHNIMLRRCGPEEVMGGQIVMVPIPDTEEAEEEVLESSTFHLAPTAGTLESKQGVRNRWYKVLRESKTYNTEEYNVLLKHMIEECKLQGIPTMTPKELEQLREWEKRTTRNQ